MIALVGIVALNTTFCLAEGHDTVSAEAEFAGTLLKQVDGKKYQAQVFAKGDRLRLEYKYAIRTELGFSAIEIIRPDIGERWYVLPQQKQLLVLPITDDTLSMRVALAGETSRTAVGDAVVAGRAALLFDVQVERQGVPERFYEWVDVETGVVLKLVSQDRHWSFEYERFRVSPQSNRYFEEPPGYRKRPGGMNQERGE
ncbi:MAG: hypothetical protein KF876_07825 [Nitrospira sp.]|nr:hypothetical protein [Nitrospira sp.]MDR4466278.1 hypothetical protein [Nitrospira sp.]MDR4469520.1 hypothetical protein [Nitrospira sp.]